MRRTHQKRLMAARAKQDPDSYFASEDLLRATATGDSTLRVKFSIFYTQSRVVIIQGQNIN